MFDPRIHNSQTYAHPLDDTYETYPAQEYYAENSYWNFYGHDQVVEVQIMHQEIMESDNTSGVYSPPLYQSSPSPLTSPSPSHPLLRQPNYWSIPTNPRAEAILRAQRELMEMVKHMPESSYELTLKDMVEEHRKIESQTDHDGPQAEQRSTSDHNKEVSLNEIIGVVNVIKREESKKKDKKHVRSESFGTKKHVRSESFESKGVFLNMVFPIPLKCKKKKKHVNGKVCPKPAEGAVKSEKDWWKRKFGTGSNDSSDQSSGTSDNNSGSSSWSTGSSGRSSAGAEISYTTARTRKKKGFLKRCYKCSNPVKQTIE